MQTELIGTSAPGADLEKFRKQATESVMHDLVNALVHENLLGITEKAVLIPNLGDMLPVQEFELASDELYCCLELDNNRFVMFRVRRQRFIQPFKLSRLPVLLATNSPEGPVQEDLGPIELIRVLAEGASEEQRAALLPNLSDFLTELGDAIEHTALSLEAAHAFIEEMDSLAESSSSLLPMERLSSLRDRPFHPTSRAKRGWNSNEYRQFSPEFGREFGLDWVAVRRDHIVKGKNTDDVASLILTESELNQLEAAMAGVGLESKDYAVLPVHPWQMKHVLRSLYKAEMEQGICIPLISGLGRFAATSSVRALSPKHGGRFHIKVPIAIYSLAALRILPPRYLNNGEKGQRLLQQVIEREPLLQKRLHLCSEKFWWGFHDPKGDPFEDKPGHLSCLVREYPEYLLDDKNVELVAMSALAVMDERGTIPAFSRLLAARSGTVNRDSVLNLFGEICRQFIETALICFRFGIMPEIHGQNVMLTVRNGSITGLLLRDHDTIRLYLPWLEREGLTDPGYVVKPGTPNSLINETPEALLSYFQTLGIQVNLYAITDVLSKAYSIEETAFWQTIRTVIQSCLADLNLPEAVRDVMQTQLLLSPIWPTRLLLAPLLKRLGTGGGSMPAGVGQTRNPLQVCES
ncbi:IucA/IucC family protein [Effusibacillus consociatus]|uniref:IucA/IucC family protein n=1 Tax=Effusibacillus consociatus TaxID=1117041 RepID=A0ABV9PY44_9BACL